MTVATFATTLPLFLLLLTVAAAFSVPMSTSEQHVSWRPGTVVLQLDPGTLSKAKEGALPQLAKDEAYAGSILKAWGKEVNDRGSGDWESVSSPLVYKCKADGSSLHGYIYRPSKSSIKNEPMPGIVLFHTGAGPQDIFLRWRADSLVNESGVFENGCVVLIADIIGDESGWAWSDRERYESVRKSILVPDDNGERNMLKGRVEAAIDAIKSQPGVDKKRIGAFGFCLGGHPILELARLRDPAVQVLATFHGVFDGVDRLSSVAVSADDFNEANASNVLVCTGADDPFVNEEDLAAAAKAFTDLRCQTELMKFENVRHGFTNPAQDCNHSEAFAYDEDASTKAWSAALSLVKQNMCFASFR